MLGTSEESASSRSVRRVQPVFTPRADRPGRATNSLRCFHGIMQSIKRSRYATAFLEPVDTVVCEAPQYYEVITEPMDLGTIQKRLENAYYYTVDEAVQDFRLMLRNCFRFNPPSHQVYRDAEELKSLFEREMQKMPGMEVETAKAVAKRRLADTSIVARCVENQLVPQHILKCKEVFGKMHAQLPGLANLFSMPLPVQPAELVGHAKPMSAMSIQQKLDAQKYRNEQEFVVDLRQVFSNATQSNLPQQDLFRLAALLREAMSLLMPQSDSTATVSSQLTGALATSTPKPLLAVLEPRKSPTISIAVTGTRVRISTADSAAADEMNEEFERRLTKLISDTDVLLVKLEKLKHGLLGQEESSADEDSDTSLSIADTAEPVPMDALLDGDAISPDSSSSSSSSESSVNEEDSDDVASVTDVVEA